jgi:hypothetical protein
MMALFRTSRCIGVECFARLCLELRSVVLRPGYGGKGFFGEGTGTTEECGGKEETNKRSGRG